ncbi:MAG: carboxypeptidase-like regulatory domain-containing protein [Planctomycetota bacterium]|nr:carboxypeptidase-like regulatory domain-containing protein [Planctomycetota bacterium]
MRVFVALLILALLLLGWMMFGPADPGPRTVADPSPQDQVSIEEDTSGSSGGSRSPVETPDRNTNSDSSEIPEVAPWYISGRVVEEDGNPAAHARAYLNPDFLDLVECDSDGLFMMEVEAGFIGDLFVDCDNDRRLQEGWPLLVGQVVSDVRAVAEDPSGSTVPLTVILTEGLRIDGIVIDAEELPVSGADVYSGATQSQTEGFIIIGTPASKDDRIWPESVSRADGTFTLAGIPVGDYSLWANRSGHAESEPVNVTPGTPEVILQLRERCILRGTVVDERGAPQDVRVQLITGLDDAPENSSGSGDWGKSLLDEANSNNPEVGQFELFTGIVGMHRLVVDSSRYVMLSRFVQLKPGLNDAVELVLKSPASLHGRVVDHRGVAVSGARFFERGEYVHELIAISEVDGIFELRIDPQHSQNRDLKIVHHEHLNTIVEIAGYSQGEHDLGDVVLREGLTVSGVVLSPEAMPVKDARVTLRKLAPPGTEDPDEGITLMLGGINGLVMEPSSAGKVVKKDTTDAAGEFSIVVEDRGDYEIDAVATGYGSSGKLPLSILRSIEGVRIDLAKVFAIEGRVIDDLGALVGGVRLTAHKAGNPKDLFEELFGGSGGGIRTTSAQDGYFRVEVPEESPYRIDVAGGQPWISLETPTVDAGYLNAEVIITEGGRIEGTVVDSITLQPITSFQLSRGGNQPANFFSFGGDGVGVEYTHPDGFFDIVGLTGGVHRLTIKAAGYMKETADVEVVLGAITSITISLQPGAAIAGRIVDTTGEPLEGVRISISRPGEEPEPEQGSSISIAFSNGSGSVLQLGNNSAIRTDEEGYFLADGIAAGDWQVRARKNGHETHSFEVRGTTPGIVTDSGTQTLYPEAATDP